MKKIYCVILSLCLISFLSSCSGGNETNGDSLPSKSSDTLSSATSTPSGGAGSQTEFIFSGSGVKRITVTSAEDWCTPKFTEARRFEKNGRIFVALKLDFAFSNTAPVVIMGDYCNVWTDETNNWSFSPDNDHHFHDEVIAAQTDITDDNYRWDYAMPLGTDAVYNEWVAGEVKGNCEKATVIFGYYSPGSFETEKLETFCTIKIEFE